MRLLSFEVINCFGFADSGKVNLDTPHNLIYVLGRNSSGKSSLLNALRAFEPGVVPNKERNFKNFNPTDRESMLRAEFQIEQGDISIDDLFKEFTDHLFEDYDLSSTTINASPELSEFISTIQEIYQAVLSDVEAAQKVRIEKIANGTYRFLSQPGYVHWNERLASVQNAIKELLGGNKFILLRNPNRQVNLSISFSDIEDRLLNQFPSILLFNEGHSLRDDLPDRITLSTLSGQQNELLKGFVQLLGESNIRTFLVSNDPEIRDEFLSELRKRVNALTTTINLHQANLSNQDLLEVTLHEKEGLQITVRTDSKKSFYSHMSDNTKFLFAYYLYNQSSKREGDTLLFDEPSNGFHPTAQEFILNFLKALAEQGNLVIVSTHSEYLIDRDYLAGVRLMSIDENKNITVRNDFYKQVGESGNYLALQPVHDAIGLRLNNLITIRDRVILAEGVTDFFYLRAWQTILQHSAELNIAPARGDTTMLCVIPLLISQGISFKLIIDAGEMEPKIRKSYAFSPDELYVVPVPKQFAPKHKNAGIEDAFTKADFKKLLLQNNQTIKSNFDHIPNSQYVGHTALKRLLADSMYTNVATYDQSQFEPETIENFRKLLDFCGRDEWFRL